MTAALVAAPLAPTGLRSAAAAGGAGAAGAVSGTVTDVAGRPLSGVCVTAFPTTAYPTTQSGYDPPVTGGTVSDPTNNGGHYRITGLAPGNYRLRYADCSGDDRFPMWYPQQAGYRGAQPVAVTAGQDISGIDAALGPGGLLTGTVTDQSGSPVAGVCVSGSTGGERGDRVRTDAYGRYQLPVRADDPYALFFDPCQAGNYLAQPGGVPVSAGRGETTSDVDAALAPGGMITGTVTDAVTGAPLPGACVSANPGNGVPAYQRDIPADASGRFVIDQLATGSYRVVFTPCGAPGDHLYQWYADAPDYATATAVPVTAGSSTGGIDAALAEGGSIAGTVTDTSGAPAVGVCATAAPTHPVNGYGTGQAPVDDHGSYQIHNLPAATYTVMFGNCNGATDWLGQTYQGQPQASANGTPVPVATGQETPGIDAQLIRGGHIEGTVTDAAGNGVSVCVAAYNSTGMVAGAESGNVLGRYAIPQLPPGVYQVQFRDCSASPIYTTQWWQNRPDQASATPVTVTADQGSTVDPVMTSAYPVTVTSLSPSSGAVGGGSVVQIRGTGFTGATGVSFGGQPTEFYVNSDSLITALSPSVSSPEHADVVVTGPAGTSPTTFSDGFSYQPFPTVGNVSPNMAPSTGGTTVTIVGNHLSQVASVAFGGIPARSFSVLDDSHITAVVPTGDAGAVSVQLATYPPAQEPYWLPATLAGRFCYDACPSPAATTTTAAGGQPTEGSPSTLTADIAVAPGTVPTGTVTFSVDGAVVGSAPLTGGRASLTWTPAEEGTYRITAAYSGDPYNAASNSAPTSVTVADASLSITVGALSGTEGTTVSSPTPVSGVVATFTDADPAGQASDFTATIGWGDGTTTTGTVAPAPGGSLQVSGNHIYAEDGSYPVTVTVADAGGATADASGVAAIADPADPVAVAADLASDLIGS